MSKPTQEMHACAVCGKSFSARLLVPAAAVNDQVAREIARAHPVWSQESHVCREDLNRFRAQYVHSLLATEKGEVSALEQEIVHSLRDHDILSRNVEEEFEQNWTLGERLADKIASFGGSWKFLILFGAFLALWILMNSLVLLWRPADPYPFILLNLMLSCLAAVQAPVIIMSQNRQEAKDRLRSQHDYQVNLKAELEIRHLHEKVDHLLSHQWERLAQIQEIQVELLGELGRRD